MFTRAHACTHSKYKNYYYQVVMPPYYYILINHINWCNYRIPNKCASIIVICYLPILAVHLFTFRYGSV